ncbi:cytochrome P450 [Chenggangzhangella methanolivorans]|uniref:cytochrome P450 n=1 Tax=Chenggangzhangella methanolivorans TaxID=1437009 RepID=UPI00361E52CD
MPRATARPAPSPKSAPVTASPAPIPVFPPRPAKPLSTFQIIRTATTNSLSVCDEQMFDDLIVSRRYGTLRLVVVSDPEAVRQVLLDKFDQYPRWTNTRRLFEFELNTGTLSSEGEVWRRHRRAATPVIDPRSIAPDLDAMIAIAERRALQLHAHARSGAVVDMQDWLTRYSTRIWNHVVTGGDPAGVPMMKWFSRVPHKPRVLDLVPQPKWMSDLRRMRRGAESAEANATLDRLIAERRDPNYQGARDMIWRMVHAIDRGTNEPLPASEARDEAASLITGGIATVRAMTWIWYLLAIDPEVEARFHAEIDEVLGSGQIDPSAMTRMPYVRRVLDESMRLYPPIPAIMRMAAQDDELCGVKVPANAVTLVMPWIIHRHRKLWTDPDRFDPDRFLPENSVGRPRLAYLPFAMGPRVCIAAAVAIQQLMIGISVLARKFRFRLADGHEVRPAGAVSLRVHEGLYMTVERRRGG